MSQSLKVGRSVIQPQRVVKTIRDGLDRRRRSPPPTLRAELSSTLQAEAQRQLVQASSFDWSAPGRPDDDDEGDDL